MGRKVVVKERLRKTYRVPELDAKINKQRLLQVQNKYNVESPLTSIQEVRCNAKCRRAGIPTPSIFDVDLPNLRITFEFIEGPSVKDFLISSSQCVYILLCDLKLMLFRGP